MVGPRVGEAKFVEYESPSGRYAEVRISCDVNSDTVFQPDRAGVGVLLLAREIGSLVINES